MEEIYISTHQTSQEENYTVLHDDSNVYNVK